MGLVSNKNFITTNAIESILQRPPPRNQNTLQYTKKPDYGSVPSYLKTVKSEINKEYEALRSLKGSRQSSFENTAALNVLPEDERLELLDKLKQRWEDAYNEFSRLPMVVDTESKINRKNHLERLLNQIEVDISKLEKGLVLIAQ
ncbi:hypothetical protein GEMRC1_008779 [Eukaryota sp. GEM-RC1]